MDSNNPLPESWRKVLSCRSAKDKIALAIHCAIAPVEDRPAVTDMVRQGYIVWIDRAQLPMAVITESGEVILPLTCDIYLLTPKGTTLCDKNGIGRR